MYLVTTLQSNGLKLKDNEILKYFLFKHPIFAFTGIILLILELVSYWFMYLPLITNSYIEFPDYSIAIVYFLFIGFLLFFWLILLLFIANISLEQYRIKKKITFQDFARKVLLFIGIYAVLIILQILYNLLKNYLLSTQNASLFQFIYYGINIVATTIFFGFFIIKLTPWHLKKPWTMEDINND